MKHSIEDLGDPRKYFFTTPNIVLTLGLNTFEFTLYAHLKRVAGEAGACWKSTATLARESGMSAGMVSKCKASLARSYDALNGKPLIEIAEITETSGKPGHRITITDIWPENMSTAEQTSPHEVELHHMKSSVHTEVSQTSPHEIQTSPHEIKNNPLKNNPKEDKNSFLTTLKSDPLYAHIDFDHQLEKMNRWLGRSENQGRRMTEQFVIRWLNKIERPVEYVAETPRTNGNRAAWEAEQRKKMGWPEFE